MSELILISDNDSDDDNVSTLFNVVASDDDDDDDDDDCMIVADDDDHDDCIVIAAAAAAAAADDDDMIICKSSSSSSKTDEDLSSMSTLNYAMSLIPISDRSFFRRDLYDNEDGMMVCMRCDTSLSQQQHAGMANVIDVDDVDYDYDDNCVMLLEHCGHSFHLRCLYSIFHKLVTCKDKTSGNASRKRRRLDNDASSSSSSLAAAEARSSGVWSSLICPTCKILLSWRDLAVLRLCSVQSEKFIYIVNTAIMELFIATRLDSELDVMSCKELNQRSKRILDGTRTPDIISVTLKENKNNNGRRLSTLSGSVAESLCNSGQILLCKACCISKNRSKHAPNCALSLLDSLRYALASINIAYENFVPPTTSASSTTCSTGGVNSKESSVWVAGTGYAHSAVGTTNDHKVKEKFVKSAAAREFTYCTEANDSLVVLLNVLKCLIPFCGGKEDSNRTLDTVSSSPVFMVDVCVHALLCQSHLEPLLCTVMRLVSSCGVMNNLSRSVKDRAMSAAYSASETVREVVQILAKRPVLLSILSPQFPITRSLRSPGDEYLDEISYHRFVESDIPFLQVLKATFKQHAIHNRIIKSRLTTERNDRMANRKNDASSLSNDLESSKATLEVHRRIFSSLRNGLVCIAFLKFDKKNIPENVIPLDVGTNGNASKTNSSLEYEMATFERTLLRHQFEMTEKFCLDGHCFAKDISPNLGDMTGTLMRRLTREVSSLASVGTLPLSYDSSIYIRVHESHLNVMRFAISGPSGTPYSYGLFIFDLYAPPRYPSVSPKVQLRNPSLVRFNPNLYGNGHVCLSLLGTWGGPGWKPDSTILQVLLSISSLILVDEPYYNEPGFERTASTKESEIYNRELRYHTLKHAILGNMLNPDPLFEDAIISHFIAHRIGIKKLCATWLKEQQSVSDIDCEYATRIFQVCSTDHVEYRKMKVVVNQIDFWYEVHS